MKQLSDLHNEHLRDKIKLDVGGQVFHTCTATLRKEKGSMLECMFSGRFPIEKDEEDCCFLDRDPKFFPIILQYLRDGIVDLPKADLDRKMLFREANYYGLEEMCKQLHTVSLNEGLVAFWKMDEGFGNKLNDSGPNALSIESLNCCWIKGPGNQSRAALQITGRHSLIEIANIPLDSKLPTGNDPYCISVWVHKLSAHWAYVVQWGTEQPNQVTGVLLNPEDCKHVWWSDNANLVCRKLDFISWHHLVMQYDGVTQQIWKDGLLVSQDKAPVEHIVPIDTCSLRIGRGHAQAVIHMADLRIHRRTLTENEIKYLFEINNSVHNSDLVDVT